MSPRLRRLCEGLFPAVQIALEVLCAVAAFLIAYRLWIGPLAEWRPGFIAGERDWTEAAPYLSLLPFIPLIRLAANWHAGLHGRLGTLSLLDDLGKVVQAATVGSAGIIVLAFLYRRGFEYRAFSYSRGVILLDWVLSMALMLVVRAGLLRWARWLRQQGMGLVPCLLVATGKQAAFLRRQLADTETWGHRIAATIEVPLDDPAGTRAALERLPALIRRHRVREVIISDPTLTYQQVVDVVLACEPGLDVQVRVVPDLHHYVPSKIALGRVGMIPTLMILSEPIRGVPWALKRAMDIAVASLGLLVLSPVLVATAIAIKLESPGPVFFRQERVGRDGRRFWFFKFRSMHVDCDDTVHRRYVQGLIAGRPAGGAKKVYKLVDDPRVTRVGRFIRRHSIDEIPQLFNVLLGHMSLVGPRPPIAYEVEDYSEWHRKRLRVRPGITGLWQTMGRSKLSYNQMVKLDIFYIEHWSLWLDLRILLRTLAVVLRGSDAY